MELHIITVCAVLSTVFLALPHYRETARQFKNWRQRRSVHREHIRRLEEENG